MNTKSHAFRIALMGLALCATSPLSATAGLVLHYTFDKTDGKTVWDSSPQGNDGLVMGAVPVASGVSGGAMRFDGVDDYIRVPRDPSLEPKEITVAAWVKIHRFRPNFGMLLHKRNGSINNNEDYDLQVWENGTIRSVVANGAQTRLDSSTRIDKGTWHHVAMTFSEPVLTLYVDGVLAGKKNHPYPLAHNAKSDLLIGATDHANLPMDLFLNCDIDEVQIYDTALPAPDIAKLAGTSENGNLVLHYTFDKDDKEYAFDSSRFGNHGLLFGPTPVAEGISGSALHFDGIDDYIRVPRRMSLEPAELTVAAWLRVHEFPDDFALLVHKRNTSFHNNEAYDFAVWNNGNIRAVLANGTQTRLDSSTPVGQKKWHHVAMVFSQPELKVYVDGRLSSSATHPYPLLHNPDSDLLIGGTDHAYYPMDLFLNCDLDELQIYNSPLSAAEVAKLAGVDVVDDPIDLLLHYSFDQPEDGIVTDDSGYGRTATVHGATWVTNGARGGAYRFADNSQVITATDAGLPSGNAPRTMMAWVKLDTLYPDGTTGMFTYGTHSQNQMSGLGFDWRNGRNQFYFTQHGGVFLSEQKIEAPGVWHHIAYTYDGQEGHHYFVDGQPSDGMSELWGPLNTILSGSLILGGHPGSVGPDGGYLDDVRIYGRVLSAEEIAALASPDQPQSDLLLHYTFDKQEEGIVTDDSGNGRTAIVHGANWVTNGVRGGAYRFDNKDQTITATDAGLPSGDAPRSVTAWMKLDVDYLENQVTWMLSYGTEGFNLNDFVLGFDWRLDRDRIMFSPGGSCFLSECRVPSPGTWVHVAYTYGGNGDHHLYVNGLPSDGMSELGGPINTLLSGRLLLGGHPESIGPDGGYLDDVRIYGRVLSAEEIAALASPDDGDNPPSGDEGSLPPVPTSAEMSGVIRTSRQDGSALIQWTGIPGQIYELLWATDLTSGFTVIASGLVATDGEMTYVHPLNGAPVGFYAVRLQE